MSPSSTPTAAAERSLIPWIAVFGAAAGLGLLASAGAASVRALSREGPDLVRSIGSTMPEWLLWALLFPVIARVSARFPLTGARPGRAVAVHLAVGLALTAVVILIGVAVSRWVYAPPPSATWSRWLLTYAAYRGVSYLVIYGSLVGLIHALDANRRLRHQAVTSAQLEAELTRAQLHALQLSLQPHFLFNTLHAIGVLNQEDPGRATRMLASLGDLLRASLGNNPAQEITLGAELDLLGHYLDIETARFPDRLTVTVTAPPEARGLLVPTLTLQPLVENAVRYGVAPRPRPSRIEVRAEVVGDRLVLTVWNDWPMADPAAVEPGVGIGTTRTRLEHLYGAGGSLELANRDGGTAAIVTLPAHDRPVL